MSLDDISNRGDGHADGGGAGNPVHGAATTLYFDGDDGELLAFDAVGFNDEVNRLLREVLATERHSDSFTGLHQFVLNSKSRAYTSMVVSAVLARWMRYLVFTCPTQQLRGQLARLDLFARFVRAMGVADPEAPRSIGASL